MKQMEAATQENTQKESTDSTSTKDEDGSDLAVNGDSARMKINLHAPSIHVNEGGYAINHKLYVAVSFISTVYDCSLLSPGPSHQ